MSDIAPNTLLDDLHPARYLKPTDLLERWQVQSITVTISRLCNEDTIPNPSDIDPATRKPRVVVQPVLYLLMRDGQEFARGYLLSARADVQSLKSATGVRTAGELIGKRITVTLGEHKRKSVLRISATPPTPHPADDKTPAADAK